MSDQQRDELDWMAFRYVAGEMTVEEAAQLERRMADDQQARDAVCRAVRLGQRLVESGLEAGLSASRMQVAGNARSNPRTASLPYRAIRAAGWMALGAAAACVVFWLAAPMNTRRAEGLSEQALATNSAQVGSPGSPADALAWAHLRASEDWAAQSELWLVSRQSSLVTDTRGLPATKTLPTWIAAMAPGSPEGENR